MTEGSLLTHAGKRYFHLGVLAGVILIGSYLYYARETTPSGGSLGGLIYGALGLLAILVLMFLGVRKRWYTSHLGTVQGWVSAHIYLGLLTLLIIPMHAGFHFGWNVHTLAFALLVLAVVSGLVGIGLYLTVPAKLTQHEGGMLPDKIESEINRILDEMEALAAGKFGVFRGFYLGELHRARETKLKGWRALFRGQDRTAALAERTQEFSKVVSQIPKAHQEDYSQFFGLVLKKTEIENQLARQLRLKNALEAWLYIHVPVSIAMVVAVIIHLLAVVYF